MKRLISATVLALTLASVPLVAAEAKTNIVIGVGVNTGQAAYRTPYRRYSERDIRSMLVRQGYRINSFDRRGDVVFVRVSLGRDVYEGSISCSDGRWLRRDRVNYGRGDGRNNGRW